jgi:hypothetical protein
VREKLECDSFVSSLEFITEVPGKTHLRLYFPRIRGFIAEAISVITQP